MPIFVHDSAFALCLAKKEDPGNSTVGMCSRRIPGSGCTDATGSKLDIGIGSRAKTNEQCELRCKHTSSCKVFAFDRSESLCYVFNSDCTVVSTTGDYEIYEMYKCNGE